MGWESEVGFWFLDWEISEVLGFCVIVRIFRLWIFLLKFKILDVKVGFSLKMMKVL